MTSHGVPLAADGLVQGHNARHEPQLAGDDLSASGPAPCDATAFTSVFVGRKAEMALLRGRLSSALSGHGHLVLIGGEPGIGKSRLVTELAHECSSQATGVLWGRCWEGAGAPAFWPWLQIVRAYARDHGLEVLLDALGPAAADIAELLPEIGKHIEGAHSGLIVEPDQARFRLFDGFSRFFYGAASTEPLVLILDDLHCADEASLLLLQFLAGVVGESRLLIVGTYRDVELDATHPLTRTLAEVARWPEHERLVLGGLSAADVAAFIERTAQYRAAATLVKAIHDKTDGNPLFLTEVVRLLLEEGRLDGPVLHALRVTVPHAIREVLERRLQRLSEPSRSLLSIAAVIGREFDLPLLQRVSGLPEGELLDTVDMATFAGIITLVADAPGRHRFTHVLIRDILYDELPVSERIRTHHRIGEALERLVGSNAERCLASLAHHFFQASVGRGIEKAVTYSLRAGDQAMAALAYEEAVGHYARALGGMTLQLADNDRTCRTLLLLGQAQRNAGQRLDARESFSKAAVRARGSQDTSLLAQVALELGEPWAIGAADDDLVGLLEEALAAVGTQPTARRARLLARLAFALHTSPRLSEGLRLSEQAVEMAQQLEDADVYMSTLIGRTYALWRPDFTRERLAITTRLASVADDVGHKEMIAIGEMHRFPALLEFGKLPDAERALGKAARIASEIRAPRCIWQTTLAEGLRYLIAGKLGDAERVTHEGWSRWRSLVPVADINHWAQILVLRRAQGRLSEVLGLIEGLAAKEPAPVWRCVLASAQSELGLMAEARLTFEGLAAHDFADLPIDFLWIISTALLVSACAFLDDAPRAEKLYALLHQYADRNVVFGAAVCEGSVSRYLGVLATTLKRWNDAEVHFEDALRMDSELRAPPLIARTQVAYAQMLLARARPGDLPKAERLLDSSAETSRRIGMQGLLGHIYAMRAPSESARPVGSLVHGGSIEQQADRQPAELAGNNRILREGDYWAIAYEGSTFRLKDSRGIGYIVELVRYPHREVHVFELTGSASNATNISTPVSPRSLAAECSVRRETIGAGGPILDAQALASYTQRLRLLREHLDEARCLNDLGRIQAIQHEIQFVAGELATNGRSARSLGYSTIERARVSVRNSITSALKRIRKYDEALWRHLSNALKTGTFCSYQPDRSIHWEL